MRSEEEVARRQDFYRLARLAGFCLFFVAIAAEGLSPPTRSLTLIFLATILSLAVLYELSVRNAPHHWMLVSVLLIFAVAGAACYALNYFSPVLAEPRGPLVAAMDPTPATDCGAPAQNDLVMIFGKDGVIGRGSGPFVPVRIGSCQAITLRRVAGGLMVGAFGYDSGDDVVYRVVDNQFHMILRGFSEVHRPDASTLRVTDGSGHETLFVRYLNKNAVRIRGTFRCGDTDPVVIGDDTVAIDGRARAGHSCANLSAQTGLEYSGTAP